MRGLRLFILGRKRNRRAELFDYVYVIDTDLDLGSNLSNRFGSVSIFFFHVTAINAINEARITDNGNNYRSLVFHPSEDSMA